MVARLCLSLAHIMDNGTPLSAALFDALAKIWVSGVVDYEAFLGSCFLRASVNL